MRQVGVLAAAGLIAIEQTPARLHEDHDNARRLAEGLAAIRGVAIDPEGVETNIVIFDVSASGLNTGQVTQGLKDRGVLANGINPREMRMVTHYDVDRMAIDRSLAAVREIVER